MTIVGLETRDNGALRLALAHTHLHFHSPTLSSEGYPPTLTVPLCPANTNYSQRFLILCFIITHWPRLLCPHLSLTPFKTFSSLSFDLCNPHTHLPLFFGSLQPLLIVFLFSFSEKMSSHRDESSIPAKSGSDITDTVVLHTHTQTPPHTHRHTQVNTKVRTVK